VFRVISQKMKISENIMKSPTKLKIVCAPCTPKYLAAVVLDRPDRVLKLISTEHQSETNVCH